MIDLQINGAGGIDLTSEPERVWEVGEILTPFGVSAFRPTALDKAIRGLIDPEE